MLIAMAFKLYGAFGDISLTARMLTESAPVWYEL